jgi:hypothetical protein
MCDGSKHGTKNLGTFDTAEEAALVYARARVPQEEEVLGLGAAAAEVLRLAAVEGLTLERSDNAVSFRGATRKRNRLQAGIGDPDTARQSPRAQRTACPKCRTEGVPHPLFVEFVCEYCLESAADAVTWPCGHPACRACFEKWQRPDCYSS